MENNYRVATENLTKGHMVRLEKFAEDFTQNARHWWNNAATFENRTQLESANASDTKSWSESNFMKHLASNYKIRVGSVRASAAKLTEMSTNLDCTSSARRTTQR